LQRSKEFSILCFFYLRAKTNGTGLLRAIRLVQRSYPGGIYSRRYSYPAVIEQISIIQYQTSSIQYPIYIHLSTKTSVIMRILGYLLCLFTPLTLWAQSADMMAQRQFQEYNYMPGMLIRQLPPKPPKVVGSHYLDDSWQRGAVYLHNQMKLDDVLLKFDIRHNQLELQFDGANKAIYGDSVLVLAGNRVREFHLHYGNVHRRFVSKQSLPGGTYTSAGFYQVLAEGPLTLALETLLEVSSANYNVALNVGDKNAKLVKRQKPFFITPEGWNPLPKKREEIEAYFTHNPQQIQAYIRQNGLNLKKIPDLQKAVVYYNANSAASPSE
jgi:hypothetical protein